MNTELEQMTAAGGTIVLGGQTLLLKQLSLGDYGQIQAWLRERLPRPFAVVAEALKDLEPVRELDPDGYAEARRQLLLSAMEDAKATGGVGAPPELIEKALNSPEGIAFVVWLCVRKQQPHVTYEQINGWMRDEDLTAIKQKLDDITIFNNSEEEEEALTDDRPRPAPRRAKKRKKR